MLKTNVEVSNETPESTGEVKLMMKFTQFP